MNYVLTTTVLNFFLLYSLTFLWIIMVSHEMGDLKLDVRNLHDSHAFDSYSALFYNLKSW